MFCPSKITSPAVGSSRRTSIRPRVDFPQPLSPTSPNVSPARMVRSTPSTAFTLRTLFRNNPPGSGKCRRKPVATSNGLSLALSSVDVPAFGSIPSAPSVVGITLRLPSLAILEVQPTPHLLGTSRKRSDNRLRQGRFLLAAVIIDVGTTVCEAASARQLRQVWNEPWNSVEASTLAPARAVGIEVEQALRIRMKRCRKNGADIRLFDDDARIHDADSPGHPSDNPEIMSDQEKRRARLRLETIHQPRIWAWIVTSRAVVGSSASMSFGRHANAMAIITRCRIPPESWCGYAL